MLWQEEVERKDVRGRSPLMLAVTLGHLETARLLMESGANINTENKDGWTGNHFHLLKFGVVIKHLIYSSAFFIIFVLIKVILTINIHREPLKELY